VSQANGWRGFGQARLAADPTFATCVLRLERSQICGGRDWAIKAGAIMLVARERPPLPPRQPIWRRHSLKQASVSNDIKCGVKQSEIRNWNEVA
jgi:hypothetical protein